MSDDFYAKLDQRIVYSSMWEEDGDTCKVWVTLLALKNINTGVVDKNITGIARLCNLPLEKVEEAFLKFQEPDPNSSSKELEGRRIVPVERGWRVVNHKHYMELGWSEGKKAYERERKAKYRANKPNPETPKPTEKPQKPNEDPLPIPKKLQTQAFMTAWGRWMNVRRGMKKPKDWAAMFREQLAWLEQYDPATAVEILGSSTRNNYQGLFPPKSGGQSKPPDSTDRNANTINKLVSGQYNNVGKAYPTDAQGNPL